MADRDSGAVEDRNVEPAEESDTAAVEWRRRSPDTGRPPLVRRLPYVELKLEHPDLEPTGYADQFYPDAVPYELDGIHRIFYWRPALSPSSPPPDDWAAACATTHGLVGLDADSRTSPPLATDDGAALTVVVGGTVGGDATTARLRSYSLPDVTLEAVSESDARLTADGSAYAVSSGERRRIGLDRRRVEHPGDDRDASAVTPELVVRYPGRREVHHPASESTYRLFPSFGLDLDDLPSPLPVPTSAGELDAVALARRLGVDRSERPYPERVLWRAFAHHAFDPHVETTPELTPLESGHVLLWTDRFEAD
ncbi:hypothetical protein [Halosimplex salinum]|uniref:hypothetical protein n=1 Tax=Halosimplex salinum TaxID=1710538 RepID=UPI0019CFF70E|nr:hypothetical protein [Halosimplex salinum]